MCVCVCVTLLLDKGACIEATDGVSVLEKERERERVMWENNHTIIK